MRGAIGVTKTYLFGNRNTDRSLLRGYVAVATITTLRTRVQLPLQMQVAK